jgi:hypothetical protein
MEKPMSLSCSDPCFSPKLTAFNMFYFRKKNVYSKENLSFPLGALEQT